MKPALMFRDRDVIALLGVRGRAGVDRLIRAGVLEVAGYTDRGHPLFTLESIRRAAKTILPRPEQDPERAPR